MILALSEGSWGTIGLIVIALLLFAIKALITKMLSPVKDKQVKQDADMLLMEQRLKSLEDYDRDHNHQFDQGKTLLVGLFHVSILHLINTCPEYSPDMLLMAITTPATLI